MFLTRFLNSKKIIKSVLVFVSLILIILLYDAVLGTAQVNGSSMFPTYQNNDFLIISKLKPIKHGDIIAVNSVTLHKFLCKRVIGVEGDHIVIDNTGLYRNNELVNEPYIPNTVWLNNTEHVDVIVQKGEIFVLGDNRSYSTDSRVLGCLKVNDIYGVSILNVTRSFGITRQMLVGFTILLWILFFLSCIFGKRKRSENVG